MTKNGFTAYATSSSAYSYSNLTTNSTGATYIECAGMPYTVNYGVYRTFNISAGTHIVNVSWNSRMTSSYPTSAVTNMYVTVTNPATNATLAGSTIVYGGTTDTGWNSGSISAVNVTGVSKIRVLFYTKNAWALFWNQQGYVNNIKVTKIS